jgi:hypothetical protein
MPQKKKNTSTTTTQQQKMPRGRSGHTGRKKRTPLGTKPMHLTISIEVQRALQAIFQLEYALFFKEEEEARRGREVPSVSLLVEQMIRADSRVQHLLQQDAQER